MRWHDEPTGTTLVTAKEGRFYQDLWNCRAGNNDSPVAMDCAVARSRYGHKQRWKHQRKSPG